MPKANASTYNKRVSSRIWHLIREQQFLCLTCKGQICNHNMYETPKGLICGTCNLIALGLVSKLEQTQT